VTTYIIKRIVQLVIVLVIVSVLVFVGMRALPGDPIRMLVTRDQLTQMTDRLGPVAVLVAVLTDIP
jgi:ABC-type dipeptide/oligopeptide/nickel transport system permease component